MSDLIDRRAAIDALAKFVPYVIDDVSTESYMNGLTDAYNLICQLPSAEPEIVRCKDCKHFRTYYHGTGSDPVITHVCVWFLDRAMGLEDYCSKGVFR